MTIKNFNVYLRYILGFSVIAGLIYHIHSKEDILPILMQFELYKIFPACLIIFFHLAFLYILWYKIVLQVGQIHQGHGMLFHSFFGGRTLGFISPGQTGELLKGLFFSSGTRLKGTSLSMIFSGYSMLVRIIIGSISCLYFLLEIPDIIIIKYNYLIYFLLLITIIIIIALFFYLDRIKKQLIKYLPKQGADLLRLFRDQLKSKSFYQFIVLLIFALIANLLAAWAFMIVLSGFSIDVMSFKGLMAFEAAYFTMSLLPITPSGIGVREGSRVYFFALIGCNQASVLCASFIIFILNIMIPAIIGLGSLKYFWKTEPNHS